MKRSNLLDIADAPRHSEADYSGWTTGLPEDPVETPSLILAALRAMEVLAVICFAYLVVRYFSTS